MYLWSISIFFFNLCHRSSSKVLSIRSLWNIYLRYTSVIQRRKVVDHFCDNKMITISLLEITISLYRLEIQICLYVEGRKVGRKRIIFVDYLLQIQISCLCRYLPHNSFQTLQFFFISGTLCLTLNSQSPSLGCKFVAFYVYFYFSWKVSHIPSSSFAWLTALGAWSFKAHPCGYQCHNSLISVVVF